MENAGSLLDVLQGLIKSVGKLIVSEFAAHGAGTINALLALAERAALKTAATMANEGDFSETRSKELLGAAKGEDGQGFYAGLRRLKKLRRLGEKLTDEIVKHLESADAEALQEGCETLAGDSWRTLNKLMGVLTAVQSLWRVLRAGERRELLIDRLKAGLQEGGMVLPPPLLVAVDLGRAAP